ncbi:MAG: anion transporter [Nostoc sp. TH1S01]|nr:anion transporter [Nostoc sp. TH1S01]
MVVLQYLVILLTYVGLGLGYLPGLRMNRATIALVGAAFLMALGLLDLPAAWSAIDYKTLIFLFGMMIISANLAASGFFQLAVDYTIRYIYSPFGLLIVLTFGSGFLSALFLNDTIALILTPLVVGITQLLNLNPVPYLLALAGATNLGSVATLSGNPQNILIGSFSGISYLDFAKALTPVALISLIIQVGWLWWLYPEVRSRNVFEGDSLRPDLKIKLPRYRIFKPLLAKSLLITTGLLVAFLLGIPTAEATLIAAGLLLVTRRLKPERILQKVDWDLLLMFCGLFILTEGVQKLGVLQWFSRFVHDPLSILGVTVLLSNLVSNVPAVLLLHQLIPHPNTQTWLLLAAASTLAGNLTLLGSVANLIVAEAVAKRGYRLTFGEHLRFGLPLTVVTLALSYFWIF